jgi:hypothetical protein
MKLNEIHGSSPSAMSATMNESASCGESGAMAFRPLVRQLAFRQLVRQLGHGVLGQLGHERLADSLVGTGQLGQA